VPREISSISRFGLTEPFEFQVGRGQIGYHSVVHVFGYNPDIDAGVEETVWTAGGILGHPASPAIMSVSSTSANDTSAGTGARTVYILGINGTGGYTSETVILNGQTAVNTVHAYDSIERMSVVTVGSGGKNAGDITMGTGVVTAGVPAVPYGQIATGENSSLIGHWTCPTGHTGYLVGGSISSGTETGSSYIVGRLRLRGTDGIIRTQSITTVSNGVADFEFKYPIAIMERECVTATATPKGNNEAASSYFQIVLIKNAL
jgi:hypothetical protein